MTKQQLTWAIVLLIFCGQISPVSAQETKPSVDQILRVWKARQEKAPTARFEMTVERTIPKGSMTLKADAAGASPKSKSGREVIPPRDLLVKGTSSLALRDPEMRYSYRVPNWDQARGDLYEKHFIDVFDGHASKSLFDPSDPSTQNYPAGYVQKAEKNRSALQFSIVPVVWALRGTHQLFFNDLGAFAPTGETMTIGGRPCLELVRSTPKENRKEVFYLDSERDYMVVRMVILLGELPKWQIDVTSAPDKTVGWLPHSWELIIRTGSTITETERRTVTSYEIGLPLEESEFDIKFPPETRVIDDTSGRSVQYVIQKDDKKGRIIPSDQTPTYEELQKPPERMSRALILTLWGGAFVLILVGWIWTRQRRNKSGVPVVQPPSTEVNGG